MSEILTNDQIAALVEAAKHGELPDDSAATRRGRRLKTVDFARPTKFTSEQERRIVRTLDMFCQTAAARLTAELRVPLELEVINTTQLTWSAAQQQLPPASLGTPLEVAPHDTRMLMTAELPFVLMAIEYLLGGAPERPPRQRKLSEIDWVLSKRLFETLTTQLSIVWQDLAGQTLAAQEVDSHVEGMQVAAISEPTLTITLESRINRHSSTLALLIPWVSIDPVADQIAGRDLRTRADDPRAAALVQAALSGAHVTMRAEVGSVEMAIDDVLGLAPGDLVKLSSLAADGVVVYAEDVPIHHAQPGRSGARRAVQIVDRREQS
ncbi:flagellar motor switch protein FliM [Conexibacter woesei]|uniref:Flagellar motor switch protein FliM n=1 Tax=Conexibacter woesei (strain DSM 14684 / CCUG 47730 / CIP 108061 / JCM 11494 / NBRC 100937 / ID131577) TaxID=469383 RepID=D3F415_CONWI|nr:FliM/FliN family flagellar motor switch protein [Conexibacter woesei]ADB48498.1 surface presentation of antigens (SPOA) protein [Conexibacter woesei DSM 14684]